MVSQGKNTTKSLEIAGKRWLESRQKAHYSTSKDFSRITDNTIYIEKQSNTFLKDQQIKQITIDKHTIKQTKRKILLRQQTTTKKNKG